MPPPMYMRNTLGARLCCVRSHRPPRERIGVCSSCHVPLDADVSRIRRHVLYEDAMSLGAATSIRDSAGTPPSPSCRAARAHRWSRRRLGRARPALPESASIAPETAFKRDVVPTLPLSILTPQRVQKTYTPPSPGCRAEPSHRRLGRARPAPPELVPTASKTATGSGAVPPASMVDPYAAACVYCYKRHTVSLVMGLGVG